jgi:hypothetical protein
MLSDVTLPGWMVWTAGALAALAVSGLVLSWLRPRAPKRAAATPLTIQPLSSVHLPRPPASSRHIGKPFMPPPAPIAPPPTDPKAEQRATFRRVGNAVLIQLADDNAQRKPIHAWVIDRSRQGLRFAAECELGVGAQFNVRPVQAPPATPWCAVEIRHCAAADGHWEIGCRFLQPPPVQLLMLFG